MDWCIIGRLESVKAQRSVADAVRVAMQVVGLDSKKKCVFNVDKDKIVQVLPQQIMTDISG